MSTIKKTELILNADGSIYHLHALPGEIAETIFLVGDPERVPFVSKHFDAIEIKKQNREFVIHTGIKNGVRASVISTGIGTDNIDIVLNEIDALFNIDFKTYSIKEQLTSLKFIRIGTSGAIQTSLPIDSWVASEHAFGFDALGGYYPTSENKNCIDATNALLYKLSTITGLESRPYLSCASPVLLAQLPASIHHGITVTMPGFYAPQGRTLRAKPRFNDDLIAFLSNQRYNEKAFTNIEMETAGIYLLSSLLGHHAISLSAILANRITDEFSANPEKTIQSGIEVILNCFLKH